MNLARWFLLLLLPVAASAADLAAGWRAVGDYRADEALQIFSAASRCGSAAWTGRR